ncbi:hypothetical protein IV102_03075 [bacterium]|nr:hypothetical protein [bacterium]
MLIQSPPSLPRLQAPKGAPADPIKAERPAVPTPDTVTLNKPDGPEPPPHGLMYKCARFLVGSVGGVVGGAIGTAVGGVIHAGDTVIPEKIQRIASKVLRPGLAAAGAAVGLYVGLAVVPLLGPAKGAMLGAVTGAVVGGSIPGAADALAASAKGAICGGWKGRKKGYALMADAFDKVAARLQSKPPTPQG